MAKHSLTGKPMTLTGRKAMYGRLFILPWVIGFIFFFTIPLVQSLFYTFNRIQIDADGLIFNWVGLDNYVYAFSGDGQFIRTIFESILNIIYQVPIIVFFSIFVAMILKEKFIGRSLMRAIFFFPVIISSGVIITILREQVLGDPAAAAGQASSLFQVSGLETMLQNANWNPNLVSGITGAISQIFDLTWKSGVQTLLMLSALHSIPDSMYEAADIEGATSWEKFWKITFVLISPTMLLSIIYSIIDYFTDYGNKVMRMIVDYQSQSKYEYSTTIAIIYFVIVLILIALVNWLLSRRTFYMVD